MGYMIAEVPAGVASIALLRCMRVDLFPQHGARGRADKRDTWPARLTAALVFLIQLVGGQSKGKRTVTSDE